MANYYKISEDDPDLEVFEKLIADFHPWFKRFKKKARGRPSYEHMNFCQWAFKKGQLPGNDDDYCPFAFTFFNQAHVNNYLFDCQLFLEKPYGRKKDKGIEKLKNSFETLVKKEDSELTRSFSLLVEESCAIWTGLIREYVIHGKGAYIDRELKNWIAEKCQSIRDRLMELSKSDELDIGELKTLDSHGRYGMLAKVLLQQYTEILPGRIKIFTVFWVNEVASGNIKKAEDEGLGLKKSTI
ncbi:hypothetical protein [Vibrio crassostreae]|uniref:hypothetical protein n=1 Tax=Vibrio crassostreae TaxID=246167 RepID=UPI00352D1EC0